MNKPYRIPIRKKICNKCGKEGVITVQVDCEDGRDPEIYLKEILTNEEMMGRTFILFSRERFECECIKNKSGIKNDKIKIPKSYIPKRNDANN